MEPTKIWFIRHGEVEEEMLGRFIGTTDCDLSNLGHHQAAAASAFLADAPIEALLVSPMGRSMDTAAPLARDQNLDVQVRPKFAEMDFGKWEGLTWQEIEELDADFARRWHNDPGPLAVPGGKSANDFAAAVGREMKKVIKEYEGKSIAIVAHAGTNRAILAHLLERPYMEMFHFAQDYGCINAAAIDDDFPQIVALNLVPGPRSKHPSW